MSVRTRDSGVVLFQVSGSLEGTCEHYGDRLKLSLANDAGRAIYSALLSAKIANKPVNLNYTNSSTPGTNHTNGCAPATMAEIWQVQLP